VPEPSRSSRIFGGVKHSGGMPAVLPGPYELGEPMKNKKKVTPAVLAANRANARSSIGPQTERGKSNTRHNALQHGILAKMVVLETDEERAGYKEIAESWNAEFSPVGLQEGFRWRRSRFCPETSRS
jgi:hypothetical protein